MTQSTAAAQPRAVVVQDISCVGRCSLTVALPVLSAAGVNTAVVPTATTRWPAALVACTASTTSWLTW